MHGYAGPERIPRVQYPHRCAPPPRCFYVCVAPVCPCQLADPVVASCPGLIPPRVSVRMSPQVASVTPLLIGEPRCTVLQCLSTRVAYCEDRINTIQLRLFSARPSLPAVPDHMAPVLLCGNTSPSLHTYIHTNTNTHTHIYIDTCSLMCCRPG